MYLDAKNLYGWAMSQKLLVNVFEWKKILLNLMKNSYFDEDSDKGYILEGELNIQKGLTIFIMICHFYQKESKFKNFISLYAIFMIKTTRLQT